jgi:hypothetical protein
MTSRAAGTGRSCSRSCPRDRGALRSAAQGSRSGGRPGCCCCGSAAARACLHAGLLAGTLRAGKSPSRRAPHVEAGSRAGFDCPGSKRRCHRTASLCGLRAPQSPVSTRAAAVPAWALAALASGWAVSTTRPAAPEAASGSSLQDTWRKAGRSPRSAPREPCAGEGRKQRCASGVSREELVGRWSQEWGLGANESATPHGAPRQHRGGGGTHEAERVSKLLD